MLDKSPEKNYPREIRRIPIIKTPLPLLIPALFVLGCAHSPSRVCVPDTPRGSNQTLHQFTRDTGTGDWQIEDDLVMGGRSRGRLEINEAGNAVFSGSISLENDGGFSSIQRDFDSLDVSGYRALCIGLKGDGRRCQVRVEASPADRHAYAFDFDTTGEWQAVEIPFNRLYAIRHGDRLDLPGYPGQTLSRVQILAGPPPGPFRLEIDRLWLVK